MLEFSSTMLPAPSLYLYTYIWHRQSVVFLSVYELSREPLNGFAPHSHGRCLCLVPIQTSLKVKVTMDKKQHFLALLAAHMRFMFGKTSLGSSTTF